MTTPKDIADLLIANQDKPLVVVTGAGVSVASGIPPFRGSADAVWENDVLEKGTLSFFHRNPVASWNWYMHRFGACLEAEPNVAHEALVTLEREWPDDFLLVSQNIDMLHELAGSTRLVKVHGSVNKARCSRMGCVNGAPHGTVPLDQAMEPLSRGELPRCKVCNKLLRPHILWFDEQYESHDDYGMPTIREAMLEFGTLIFIGTSFSVGITDYMAGMALHMGRQMVVIDPVVPKLYGSFHSLSMKAEEALPAILEALK